MMTSWNWNIFRVTGHLCGEFTGHKGQWRRALLFSLICAWIRLSKQWWGWWFEAPSRPLWHHCNDNPNFHSSRDYPKYALDNYIKPGQINSSYDVMEMSPADFFHKWTVMSIFGVFFVVSRSMIIKRLHTTARPLPNNNFKPRHIMKK